MKKIISITLVLVLMLSMLPAVHAETYNGSLGLGINWTLDTATGVLVVDGQGDMKDFGSGASSIYTHRAKVKSVIINPGITSIGNYTFYFCENMTSISIPEGVTRIGNYAFRHCKKLGNVALPSTLKSIGTEAFYNCFSMTALTIPASVETIGDRAFSYCTGLTSVKMYDGLKTIGNTAFSYCESVPYIRVPDTVISIGQHCFQACKSMTHIQLSDSMTTVPARCFVECTNLRSVILGDHTELIDDSAFTKLKNLRDIVLPQSLKQINSGAFSESGLEDIILPESVELLEPTAFSSCTSLRKIAVLNPDCITRYNYLGADKTLGVAGITAIYGHNSTYTGTGEYVTAMEYADKFGFAFYFINDTNLWTDSNEVYNPFRDVPSAEYYFAPVLWAYDTGITAGTTANTFSPDGQCQRGQVVTFLHRAMEYPEHSLTASPFTDVPQNAYYYNPVMWAFEEQITMGMDATHFAPDATVTRGQFVTFLWRSVGKPDAQSNVGFADVPASEYYAEAVAWAVENGITQGTGGGMFSPNATCTRAQVVTFLYRLLG